MKGRRQIGPGKKIQREKNQLFRSGLALFNEFLLNFIICGFWLEKKLFSH